MAGEEAQDSGRDGLKRAKRWLEFTTRVDKSWTHQDRPMSELLEFRWPHSDQTFSYDLGGTFRGGELNGQSFVAEVKNYKKESDLPVHFRDFLAKSYVAFTSHPDRCDNFLWISWSPFQAQKWDEHATPASVRKAVLHRINLKRVLGVEEASEGESLLDLEALTRVADKVWLVTLSHRQERARIVGRTLRRHTPVDHTEGR